MVRATPSCLRPAPLIKPCGRADGERVGTAVIARISAHPVRSSSHGKVETTACLRAMEKPRPSQCGADLFGFAPIARVRRRPNDLGALLPGATLIAELGWYDAALVCCPPLPPATCRCPLNPCHGHFRCRAAR